MALEFSTSLQFLQQRRCPVLPLTSYWNTVTVHSLMWRLFILKANKIVTSRIVTYLASSAKSYFERRYCLTFLEFEKLSAVEIKKKKNSVQLKYFSRTVIYFKFTIQTKKKCHMVIIYKFLLSQKVFCFSITKSIKVKLHSLINNRKIFIIIVNKTSVG